MKYITILFISLAICITSNAQDTKINWTDVSPVWNADGSQIYFYSYRHGNAELYTMNPDGSNQTRLTHTDYHEWWMQPIEDGKLLVASDRDADKAFTGSSLYSIDLESKELVKLTDETGESWAAFPKLSRSTSLAVYARSHTFGLNVPVEIWLLDLKTGKNYAYPDRPEHNNFSAAISEDGKYVYYVSKREGEHKIYKNNIDGNNEVGLYIVNGRPDGLSVSPDGEWIAFNLRSSIISVSKTNKDRPISASDREIYLARTDGSQIKQLTSSKGMNMQASWSPDGKTITFESSRHGFLDIFSINVDGSNEKNLTRTSIK